MTGWRSEVDTWWGARLRLPPAALRTGGTWVMPGLGHIGVMAVTGAGRPLGYGPARALPVLRQVMSAVPAGPLAEGGGRFPGGPLAAATRVVAALGIRPGTANGPAWHGYVTEASLTRDRSPAVRPLAPADLPLLSRLREQAQPAERDESGTTGLPAYGYLDGGVLLAVACLGLWHEMPTLGVLTHPAHRGRGLARAVAPQPPRPGWTAGRWSSTAPGGPTPPRSRWPGTPGSRITATAWSSSSAMSACGDGSAARVGSGG